MKGKVSTLISIVAFLMGALICYFLLQWKWLRIDTSVNVVETIIAVISIAIGVFIAVHIQKRNNQNQNLYNYLISRLDSLWSEFNSFFIQAENGDTIELSKVNAFVKQFRMRNSALCTLLQPIAVSNRLDGLCDELELILVNGLIRSNIIYYDGKKEHLIDCGKRIQAEFTQIYLSINSKS